MIDTSAPTEGIAVERVGQNGIIKHATEEMCPPIEFFLLPFPTQELSTVSLIYILGRVFSRATI